MKRIVCKSCGSNEFAERRNYRICIYCNSKYALEDEKASSSIVIANGIALNDDVKRLLDKCQSDPANARRYANLILDIDPTNQEALRYL